MYLTWTNQVSYLNNVWDTLPNWLYCNFILIDVIGCGLNGDIAHSLVPHAIK